MSRKKIILIITILCSCLLVLLAIVAAGLLMAKEDKWIFADSSNGDNDEVVEDDAGDIVADEISPDLYAITNCKLYSLSEADAEEIPFANDTDVDCFDKKLFRGNYVTVNPDYDSLILLDEDIQNDKFLLDVENAVVHQIEFDHDNALSVAYNPVNNKLYSYLSDDGLYSGTYADPLNDKIHDFDTEIFGRGGIFSEDFRMRISPDGQLILVQDTFTSENGDGSEFTTLKILDLSGDIIYETRGSFAQFIDNDRIIFSTTDSMGGGGAGNVMVVNLDSMEENLLDISAYAYNIDVISGHILIDYFSNGNSLKVGNMRTVILNSETLAEEDTLSEPLAYNLLLNENVIIGKKSFNCEGEWDAADTDYPCPMEGAYGFYEESVDSFNLDSNVQTVLKEFDTSTQPRFID